MSAVPAARYLTDFGADGEASPPHGTGKAPAKDEAAAVAAQVDDAFSRGVDAGRSAAEGEFEVKLEEQRVEFAGQLEAARQEWVAGTGEMLMNGVLGALQDLEKRVAETTARILKPFLAAELHRQALAELRANLETLLAADSGISLAITGPADVLDALREQLAAKQVAVTYTPGDDCDVRIIAGQSTLETRLKGWMAKLDEAAP